MFEITVVENGKRVRTETRDSGTHHISAWRTYRDCGWTVTRHNFYEVTVSRVV